MGPDVVVVGSANVDVVLRVAGIPEPGETVLARHRELLPGGKGLNAAVAAARCGAATALVAAVGGDADAQVLREQLARAGVVHETLRTSGEPTGTAYVVVDDAGENAITVSPGANATLLGLLAEELELVRHARVLLCQLEVPVDTVVAAARAAAGEVVLNAAPARDLPPELLEAVDVLVVNEHEALAVAGQHDVGAAVRALLRQVDAVVVTLGADGALLARSGEPEVRVPAAPARAVVDTTGAGDTFCGALAAARAGGQGLVESVQFACAAASLGVERPGASAAAPSLEEVTARLAAAYG